MREKDVLVILQCLSVKGFRLFNIPLHGSIPSFLFHISTTEKDKNLLPAFCFDHFAGEALFLR
jgi:hypothetical protein